MTMLPDYLSYARDITYLNQLREAVIAHPHRDDQFGDERDIEQESIDAVGRDDPVCVAISDLADIAPTPAGPDPDNDEAGETGEARR